MSGPRPPLAFDPVEAAARLWAEQWAETPRMRAVTSVMRVHQLVLTELDELLRPLGLTFARYEVLVLLSFSRRGALPLGKIGERLQVHATSVTPLVRRLEAAGLLRRSPHPRTAEPSWPRSPNAAAPSCSRPPTWSSRPGSRSARSARKSATS